MYDATFGLQATDALALHRELAGVPQTMTAPSIAGVPTFDDKADYYEESLPYVSVRTAGAGVVATVATQGADSLTVSVANQVATP